MLERGEGSIVNVSAVVSSVKGAPNRFAYGTSMAAGVGLTKSIAADFVTATPDQFSAAAIFRADLSNQGSGLLLIADRITERPEWLP